MPGTEGLRLVFFGGDHFFPSGCAGGFPSRRARFASAMQVDSWAFGLPFVVRGLPLGRG